MTAAVTEIPFLSAQDDVTINHPQYAGQVWTVHRVKRSKAIIKPQGQPNHRGLDADMTMLVKTGTRSSLSTPANPTPTGIAQVQFPASPRTQGFKEGVVVRINRRFQTYSTTDLLVITKVNSTSFSLDRLGGNRHGERGIRTPHNGVTIVDLDTILR